MMKVLLPCGKMDYTPYKLDNNPFFYYDGRCCYGKCPKTQAAATARLLRCPEVPKVCGWANVFQDAFCPLELGNDVPFSWQVACALAPAHPCSSLPLLATIACRPLAALACRWPLALRTGFVPASRRGRRLSP